MPHAPKRNHATILLTLAALCGCSEPTKPDARAKLVPAPLEVVAQATAGNDANILTDLLDRIFPSFEDQRLADRLTREVARLNAASRAGDSPGAQASIAAIRKLLARSSAHPSNIGAIRLAILRVEQQLDLPESSDAETGTEDPR